MSSIINRFDGPYAFLSNFSESPVVMAGMTYPTVENAFQAAKTLNKELRVQFTRCSPNYAKCLGRRVDLRPDWEDVKDSVMFSLLEQKFAFGTPLANALIRTQGAYLCEGNTWHDNHFGACTCDRCLYVEHHNVLGMSLMCIRENLLQSL